MTKTNLWIQPSNEGDCYVLHVSLWYWGWTRDILYSLIRSLISELVGIKRWDRDSAKKNINCWLELPEIIYCCVFQMLVMFELFIYDSQIFYLLLLKVWQMMSWEVIQTMKKVVIFLYLMVSITFEYCKNLASYVFFH